MSAHPNHVTTFSNKNCVAVSTVQFVTYFASAHLVKYYVVVIMYLSPDLLVDGLIGPRNSMAHLSNAWNITCGCKGISSLLDGFPTL
jgi:hypothetical protein